MVTINPLNFV